MKEERGRESGAVGVRSQEVAAPSADREVRDKTMRLELLLLRGVQMQDNASCGVWTVFSKL